MCARLGLVDLVVFDVTETSLLSRCEIHVGLDEVAKHKGYEYRIHDLPLNKSAIVQSIMLRLIQHA